MSLPTFADAVRALMCGALSVPGVEEAARQQAAIDARAAYVLRETAMPLDDARRVALFSLRRWAQRYPDPPHDLGGRAAVYLATWCRKRAVAPTDDVLHAALREWQAVDMLGEAAAEGAAEVRDLAAMLHRLRPERAEPGNRHERRARRSRRWRA